MAADRPEASHPVLPALTAGALVAFAANSILCRLALGANRIDAGSFTAARLVSGALALFTILALTRRGGAGGGGAGGDRARATGWIAGMLLFLYAAPFSFAYVDLGVGTGALLLFGAVQVTMIAAGLRSGERPRAREWIGLALALSGLVTLVLPGLTAPAPLAAALMLGAGIAWGFYSLRGRGAADPLADTGRNFAQAAVLGLALSALVALGAPGLPAARATPKGIGLAIASGAIASGVGYVLWYAALRGLSATRAATLQLAVPVIAAAGGVLFLGERVGFRLVVAATLILGGVGLAVTARNLMRVPRAPTQAGQA